MPQNHSGVRSALAPRPGPAKADPPAAPAGTQERPASYSQLSTYADCGKRYELAYVRRVKRRPGVWFPAGTAVHRTIERYLLATLEGNQE